METPSQQIQESSRIQMKKRILISHENILLKFGVSETLSEKKNMNKYTKI